MLVRRFMIKLFRNEEFPFYFVQIAPFQNGDDHFCGVEVRNAQRKVLELPNTAMVVTSDISTTDDIHPKDKKSVGIRLANLALNNIYKTKSQLVNGPLFDKFEINKNKIIVHFKYADGLYFKSKKSNQFEIAGQDGVFHQAEATIKNQTIVLFSNKVNKPTQVRYAWKNKEQADLFNKANLPASSFITE
jgi:sialate O-acetylesterase